PQGPVPDRTSSLLLARTRCRGPAASGWNLGAPGGAVPVPADVLVSEDRVERRAHGPDIGGGGRGHAIEPVIAAVVRTRLHVPPPGSGSKDGPRGGKPRQPDRDHDDCRTRISADQNPVFDARHRIRELRRNGS